MAFFLFAFFKNLTSPSRSDTTMSGHTLFSINALVAPSATILVIFLNFFKIGIDNDSEGPAPITKITCFSIFLLNLLRGNRLVKIESKILADSLSFSLL